MDYSTILYETDGGKARITLNRPDKLNAISWQMQQELRDALWAADRDPHVHVAILRGAGRAFSSGYDITPPPGELTHAASASTTVCTTAATSSARRTTIEAYSAGASSSPTGVPAPAAAMNVPPPVRANSRFA